MIIEVIAETLFPILGRILGYIFIEIIGHIFLYSIGYVFLKIVTFGKYPKKYISASSDEHQESYVILVGVIVCILLFIAGAIYSNV